MNNAVKTISHSFSLWLVIAISFPLLFGSCKDDDDITGIDEELVDEDVEIPPVNDELKVKTHLRAYVCPGNYCYSGQALINRLQDRSSTADATIQTFILDNGNMADLTDWDYRTMAAVLARGGSLVVCQPTRQGLQALDKQLKDVITSMYKNGELEVNEVGYQAIRRLMLQPKNGEIPPVMVDNSDSNDILFDLLAFRGGLRHAVADVAEQAKADANNEPTDYLCGRLADETAEWLDRPDDTEARLAKGRQMLAQQTNGTEAVYDNLSTTDQFEYQVTAKAGHKTALMTLLYDVWAVNDTQGNDYYLLKQEIRCANDQFKCGHKEKNKWVYWKVREAVLDSLTYVTNPSKNIGAYWAYMHDLSTNVKFSEKSASIKDISPTQIEKGSTTYTQSTHIALSMAFLKPDVKVQLDMTQSVTRSIPDITTDFNLGSDGISPKWSYTISRRPKILPQGWYHIWQHEVALPSYYSTFIVGHSWIWKVSHNDKTFSFDTHVRLNMEALWYDEEHRKSGYYTFTNPINVTSQLTPPSRYEQLWLMEMDVHNDVAFNYMKDYIQNFVPKFSLYTVTKDDRLEIDRRIAEIVKDLTTHKNIFQQKIKTAFQLKFYNNNESKAYKIYNVNFSQSEPVTLVTNEL
ncbi:MAG: hypothetical protein MR387_01770 [Phocaeicola plebeius]|nr:hypothetical protein [Phocaeicola plebeius]